MTMPTETDELVVEQQQPQEESTEPSSSPSWEEPDWLTTQRQSSLEESWGEKLEVPEWQDDDNDNNDETTTTVYRGKNGWQGRDLIHDAQAPVRISEYYVRYGEGEGLPYGLVNNGDTTATADDDPRRQRQRRGGVGTTLTGIVHFTKRAESHRGYCHGGSMCSVLDDVIGWCAFCVTGTCRPWSGFTVQVNTQLRKPIPVQSTLLVRATVTQIERRKVFIQAALVQPPKRTTTTTTTLSSAAPSTSFSSNDSDIDNNKKEAAPSAEVIHASGDGLVVLNRGVLPELATRGSLHSWPSSIELT